MKQLNFDVAVIGGGPGGIPAAIAAARQGAKVLLVEKLLSGCDKLDISILREVLNRESYSKIAAKLFIAENTISYRIKKILSLAPDKTKDEIFSLLAQFLF